MSAGFLISISIYLIYRFYIAGTRSKACHLITDNRSLTVAAPISSFETRSPDTRYSKQSRDCQGATTSSRSIYLYDSLEKADWLRSQNYFHQIRFVPVQALEPGWALFQRRHGADQRLYLNGARGHQFNRSRVLAIRCAGALNADLAGNHGLKRKIHVGRNV